MAWNEQGDDQDKKKDQQDNSQDPWSGRQRNTKKSDLDDALVQLQKKFNGLMGKKQGSGNGGGSNQQSSIIGGLLGIAFLITALAVIWFITGFFVVQPPEKAVTLRFGRYQDTVGPGLHWIPRFIDSEYRVNVQRLFSYTYPEAEDALMLTKDQNIVAVSITVQFRVDNPQHYLFNVVNPVNSLKQATASALRQVIGRMDLDSILTTGREQLRQEVKNQLDITLQRYKTGLKISTVLLKSARAPDAVRDAFDDAVKAQEDEKRFVNQAQAYAMKVEPIAQGQAKRLVRAAQAYQQKVVLEARANTAPFLAILPEYLKAPKVTRERMYMDAIQTVLENSSKILVDGKGANNLLYLPLNKLLANLKPSTVTDSSQSSSDSTANQEVTATTPTQSRFSLTSRPTRAEVMGGYGSLGENQ